MTQNSTLVEILELLQLNARKASAAEERIRAILAKPYWDYEEAALVLNVKVKTLRNMKYLRELTFSRFGRKVYFPRDAILKELRRNTVVAPRSALEGRRRRQAS